MRGLMMDIPLLISGLIEHAERMHASQEIVTRTVEGPVARTCWGEIAVRARRLAKALTALGVRPGDRVATLAWNTARHLEVTYAVAGMGAVVHTINPRLHATQVAWMLDHAEDGLVFVDLTFVPLIEAALATARTACRVVVMTDRAHMPEAASGSPLAAALCQDELIDSGDDGFDWPTLDENEAAVLCYTSGTTGEPKGVLYSHRSQVLHAFTVALPDTFYMAECESVLPVVPMFHVNAWGIPYAAAMTGTRLVMPGARLDGPALTELMAAEGVTMAAGVPTVWLALIQHLRASGARLPTLRRVVIGGAAAPAAMISAFQDEFGIEVRHAWGMTEMSPIGTVGVLKRRMQDWPAADRLAIQEKQGRPPFGTAMKVVDEDGRELPRDGHSAGTLKVRGPAIASAYYRDAGSSAHDAEGWFATGDIATLDADGFMHITDRAKDMIKSGGEWISSILLENLAVSHPGILQAAVIGVPDPRWGERPVLIAVPQPGHTPTEESLRAFFESRVAKWCIPDRLLLVDALPLGPTGKVQKRLLRERYGQAPEAE